MKILKTRTGARVLHGKHVLSEVRAEPGPTHSIFDVLSAAVAVLEPAPPVALLGFAGGGMLAPLRALGVDVGVEAVDLSLAAVPTFRKLGAEWAGEVSVEKAEASAWLRAQRRRFACIVEDLSQQVPGDVVKPRVSFDTLPELIAQRLAPGGHVVINLLPEPKGPQRKTVERIARPYRQVRRVMLEGFVNEVLVAGREVPDAAALSRKLKLALWTLGSNQAEGLRVRTLR